MAQRFLPHFVRCYATGLVVSAILVSGIAGDDAPKSPVKVIITQGKQEASEDFAPVDRTPRLGFEQRQGMILQLKDGQEKTAVLQSHLPMFSIDGKIMRALIGKGGPKTVAEPLPKTSDGKERIGFLSRFSLDDVNITMISELVPSKARKAGEKRLMDTVLVRFQIENKGA